MPSQNARKATQNGRQFETQLQATLNIIPAYTWYAGPSGALIFVNERCANYLGLPAGHPLRFGISTDAAWDSHIALLHPDDHEGSRRIWATCLTSGCAGEMTFRVRNGEGAYRWFLSRAEPLLASDGTLLYWIGINLDIQDQRQADFYLAEGERLAHIGSWAFGPAGFDYWSSELLQIHGLDARGKAPTVEEYLALVHPEDRDSVVHEIERMLATNRGFDFTKRIVRPDGRIRRVRCVGNPAAQEGDLRAFVGTGIDVTEQEQLTEELRRNEFYLGEAARLAHMGSWVFDPAGFFSYWSRELFHIYALDPATEGVRLEEYLARVHPQDREFMRSLIRRMIADASGCDVTKRIVLPNGDVRHIRCVGAPVVENGRLKQIVGTAMDVTEHELVTQTLRRREAYLAEAQRLSHTGSFGWNVFTDEHSWSDETFRIFEFDPSWEISVSMILDRVHPQDRASVKMAIAAASRGEGIDLEHRLLMPDGRIKYLHVVGKVEEYYTGGIEVIGAVMDVTARKLTELELRRNKAHLADAQRLSRTGTVGMDVSTKRIFWSEESARIYGYAPGTEPTPELILQRVHPDDVHLLKSVLERAGQGGTEFDFEHRLLMPDGSIKHIYNLSHCLTDGAGSEEIVGAIMDITERRVAEEVIRRSEAYLIAAQRLSHTGSFGWKPDSGEIVWSGETYRIFDYDCAEKPTLDMVFQRIHPHDRALAQQIIEGVSPTTDFEQEYRLVMPGGALKHIHVRGRALFDSSGNIEVVGAVSDITERKTAEDKIRRLVDAGILGIFIANLQGEIVEANQAFLRMLQYGHDDLVSGRLRWAELTPVELRERDQRAVTEALANGFFQAYEKEFLRKDGSRVPVLLGGALFPGANEGVAFVLDLSEQKRTEDALRRSESYLAEAQRLSLTGSFGCRLATGEMFWSDETFRIYGYDRSTRPALERVLQRVHPEDRALIQERIDQAYRDGQDCHVECRLLLPDDSVKHIRIVAHASRTVSGTIEFIGAVMDVTERKTAEGKIREQEMEFRQILDLVPQLVSVYGPNHARIYANRVMLDYLGLSLELWRERPKFGEAIHPDDRGRATSHFDRLVSSAASFELEVRLRKSDGSYRWFLARCNPVCDDKGQIMRWYVACTDIDDRKRAEQKLQEENSALREEVDKASMLEEIVGASKPLKAVLSRIAKVAPTDSTVMITGETGTGKELIARAVHKRSHRSGRPFVSVNCAAAPRDLILSELFGHEKGAFTGATQRRLGRFELADGGTVFLDEIGELVPDTQVALLRVLQEREFERIGGGQTIQVNVRVIAATNRDLKKAVANGTFRQDLFYRLNVFPIALPPLRERKDDILMLVEYFIQRYATKAGKTIRSIDKKTLDVLQTYDWPGNIRELQNVIERSVILTFGDVLSVDELWLTHETTRPGASTAVTESRTEREIIEKALAETRGRVSGPSGAAAKLQIPASTLATRIKALKINRSQFKFL